jgi:hypothetical protein
LKHPRFIRSGADAGDTHDTIGILPSRLRSYFWTARARARCQKQPFTPVFNCPTIPEPRRILLAAARANVCREGLGKPLHFARYRPLTTRRIELLHLRKFRGSSATTRRGSQRNILINGSPTWARTRDLRINSTILGVFAQRQGPPSLAKARQAMPFFSHMAPSRRWLTQNVLAPRLNIGHGVASCRSRSHRSRECVAQMMRRLCGGRSSAAARAICR